MFLGHYSIILSHDIVYGIVNAAPNTILIISYGIVLGTAIAVSTIYQMLMTLVNGYR